MEKTISPKIKKEMEKIALDCKRQEAEWINEATDRIIPKWQQALMAKSHFFRWLFHYGLETATDKNVEHGVIRRITISQWGIRRARAVFRVTVVCGDKHESKTK